jgi:hypothetical protein
MKYKPFDIIVGILMVIAMIALGPVLIVIALIKSVYEILRDGLVAFIEKGKDIE